MRVARNILWWVAFLVLGIVCQLYVPGLDALLTAVLLVTQERDYKTMVWLLPTIVLLQEGMGSLHFGSSVFTILAVIALYKLASAIPVAARTFFHLLVILGCGFLRGFFGWFFATLQNAPVDMELIVHDGLVETVYVLVSWPVLTALRRFAVPHDEKKAES